MNDLEDLRFPGWECLHAPHLLRTDKQVEELGQRLRDASKSSLREFEDSQRKTAQTGRFIILD